MNENAQKWIDALRSGEYQQSTSRLRTGDTYCCLGVACELHRQARDDKWDASYGEAFTYLEAGAVLPDEVIHWLGLKNSSGIFHTPYFVENEDVAKGMDVSQGYTELIEANDSGVLFSVIADMIETRATELFHPDPLHRITDRS